MVSLVRAFLTAVNHVKLQFNVLSTVSGPSGQNGQSVPSLAGMENKDVGAAVINRPHNLAEPIATEVKQGKCSPAAVTDNWSIVQ